MKFFVFSDWQFEDFDAFKRYIHAYFYRYNKLQFIDYLSSFSRLVNPENVFIE